MTNQDGSLTVPTYFQGESIKYMFPIRALCELNRPLFEILLNLHFLENTHFPQHLLFPTLYRSHPFFSSFPPHC